MAASQPTSVGANRARSGPSSRAPWPLAWHLSYRHDPARDRVPAWEPEPLELPLGPAHFPVIRRAPDDAPSDEDEAVEPGRYVIVIDLA